VYRSAVFISSVFCSWVCLYSPSASQPQFGWVQDIDTTLSNKKTACWWWLTQINKTLYLSTVRLYLLYRIYLYSKYKTWSQRNRQTVTNMCKYTDKYITKISVCLSIYLSPSISVLSVSLPVYQWKYQWCSYLYESNANSLQL